MKKLLVGVMALALLVTSSVYLVGCKKKNNPSVMSFAAVRALVTEMSDSVNSFIEEHGEYENGYGRASFPSVWNPEDTRDGGSDFYISLAYEFMAFGHMLAYCEYFLDTYEEVGSNVFRYDYPVPDLEPGEKRVQVTRGTQSVSFKFDTKYVSWDGYDVWHQHSIVLSQAPTANQLWHVSFAYKTLEGHGVTDNNFVSVYVMDLALHLVNNVPFLVSQSGEAVLTGEGDLVFTNWYYYGQAGSVFKAKGWFMDCCDGICFCWCDEVEKCCEYCCDCHLPPRDCCMDDAAEALGLAQQLVQFVNTQLAGFPTFAGAHDAGLWTLYLGGE